MSKCKYEKQYRIAAKEYEENPFLTLTYFQNKYGFGRAVFSNWLKKHGYQVRRAGLMTVEKAENFKRAVKLYQSNPKVTIIQAALENHISKEALAKYLKKMHIARNTFSMPDYCVDESYFSNINSEEKAYWYGFIAADGCVRKSGVAIELNSIDEKHLDKFLKAIKTNIPIRHRKTRSMSSVEVHRQKMAEDLMKLGCVVNKTEYGFIDENAIKDYEMDFIRGFVDGDGYIDKNLKKNRLVITSKSPKMIKSMMKILEAYHPRLQDCGSFYRIHVERKECFFQLLDDLYKHATIYLDRKYQTYKMRINAHLGQRCGRPKGLTEKKSGRPSSIG